MHAYMYVCVNVVHAMCMFCGDVTQIRIVKETDGVTKE